MNHAKRSLELQRRIMHVVREIDRLKAERVRLRVMLKSSAQKRPSTGATKAVMEVLAQADRPLTARDISDRLPDRDRHRVQLMVRQQWALGHLSRTFLPIGRRPGHARYAYTLKAKA